MKIEVLGTERRRRWSLQDKLQIVEETMQPGVTVTEVARRHGLAPSVVFTWRRLAREGRLGDTGPAFMPVEITPESWLGKFAQRDKWSFCLTAARMAAEQEKR